MKKFFLIIAIFLFLSLNFSSFPQESLTITTYYPSPTGIYKELRAKRMAIGDNFYKSADYCWEGGCTQHFEDDLDLAVEGKVSIGTSKVVEEDDLIKDTQFSLKGNFKIKDGWLYIKCEKGKSCGIITQKGAKLYPGNTGRTWHVTCCSKKDNSSCKDAELFCIDNPEEGGGKGCEKSYFRVKHDGDVVIGRSDLVEVGDRLILKGKDKVDLFWINVNESEIGDPPTNPHGGNVIGMRHTSSVNSREVYILGKTHIGNPYLNVGWLKFDLIVSKDLIVKGVIKGEEADIAEYVECSECEPADVVVINPDGGFSKSIFPYDTKVAGVISKNPQIVLGEKKIKLKKKSKEFKLLALKGIVFCKVTNENGPIKRGDLLVTSSKPGYAMRADLNKLKPGMVVGKALENFDKEKGEILILIE